LYAQNVAILTNQTSILSHRNYINWMTILLVPKVVSSMHEKFIPVRPNGSWNVLVFQKQKAIGNGDGLILSRE